MEKEELHFPADRNKEHALARALAIDPKILILDDSFSAVDTHTEEEILKELKRVYERTEQV
ncbi:MAG: hypothetical protein MZV64_02500 [Ignavibacteriales bacterium]|nr:hypothetical protein [Ignavibacteriales bacterium]